MIPPEFTDKLKSYLGSLAEGGGHEARRARFLGFVQEAFGISLMDPQYHFEEHVYRGFVDTILGNLVFEFKQSLAREREDAQSQFKHYLEQLKQRHPGATFTAVATDGLAWEVYAPVWEGSQVIDLKLLTKIDLRRARPEEAFFFLDSLLFVFRTLRARPTAQGMVAHLGPRSPIFGAAQLALGEVFGKSRGEPAVAIRFQEWQRYLARVYGEEVGDEALFLKHTYLATLAKFMAFFFLEGPSLEEGRLPEVVTGAYFAGRGISNFIEDDFFTWFLQCPQETQGREAVARLVRGLLAYDFGEARQDLLKELYEELLGQEARHNLGEYYTPDWLAEYMLDGLTRLGEHPEWRVLDPACGSGTFLFIALRRLRSSLENLGRSELLKRLVGQVVGVDVHPVAVTIARTNYLLALEDLAKPPPERFSIPVYLADSLRLGEVETTEKTGNPEDLYPVRGEDNVSFSLPGSLVAEPERLDGVIDRMRDFLGTPSAEREAGFGQALEGMGLSPFAQEVCRDNFRGLLQLYAKGKDTVWLFILKNVVKPHSLRQAAFDLVVGNPPWLSFRYIRDSGYARFVKEATLRPEKRARQGYQFLSSKKGHLFTQMDLAALFFVRAADLYVKEGGSIAFVMPRGVFSADQYGEFTGMEFWGERPFRLGLKHVVDLAAVEPLFRQQAAVLVAQKGEATAYPVSGTVVEGELPGKNLPWAEAQVHLTRKALRLERVLGKLLPQAEAQQAGKRLGESPYYAEAYEGATIVPRNLFFVRAEPSPPQTPLLATDEEEARQAKAPWAGVRMGPRNVEARFIYATLLGGDVVPFGCRKLRPVVLPLGVLNGEQEGKERLALLNVSTALQQGYPGLAGWLQEAERHWRERATKDARGEPKIPTILHQLNYRNKLTRQELRSGWKVLYNTSGTNIAACGLNVGELLPLELGGGMAPPAAGFAADSKTFYVEVASADEAHYLATFLNAPVVDETIKPLQSRGLFGERDIQRRPFLLGLPRFDPALTAHRRLAEIGRACQEKVTAALPELVGRYRGSGALRGAVRKLLQEELKTIDWHVRRLI